MSAARCTTVRVALAAAFATAACTELPVAQEEFTRLDIVLSLADSVLVGDTVLFTAQALDPLGNLVVAPPLVWDLERDGFPGRVEVIRATTDSLTVVGTTPGQLGVGVALPPSHAIFTGASVTGEAPVQYGWISARFDVGPDTVLTRQGQFGIPYNVADYRGRPVEHGTLEVTNGFGGPIRLNAGSVPSGIPAYADREGVDTIYLTHTACAVPCGDTLVVRVEPVAATIRVDPRAIGSLGETAALTGQVLDSAGLGMNGAITWRLVNPADTVIIQIVDSTTTGLVLSRGEGTATVSATHLSLQATTDVAVRQQIAGYDLSGLSPYQAGVGVRDTVRVQARDGAGNPITLGSDREITWFSTVPGVAGAVSSTFSEVVVETASIGQTAITLSIQVCPQFDSCVLDQRSMPLTVLPEPDSVRIVSEYSPAIGQLGPTGAYFFGDIFLPGQTIQRALILWTSLDPGVATVDEQGQVIAYTDGVARLVGRMGMAADTLVVTIASEDWKSSPGLRVETLHAPAPREIT